MFPRVMKECQERVAQIVNSHDLIQQVFSRPDDYSRASYLIPQLFIELGYGALTNADMEHDLRSSGAAFSLVCLSCGVADDLIDSSRLAFEDRMALGAAALAFAGQGWMMIAQISDDARRQLLSHTLSAFIADGLQTAKREIAYAGNNTFALESYTSISTDKAGIYIRHSLLLAHALSNSDPIFIDVLLQLSSALGLAMQLIDDILDCNETPETLEQGLTYPAFLLRTQGDLGPAYLLIDEQLEAAQNICGQLPYPYHILTPVTRLRSLLIRHHG
ncbi:MAG TPA: class 1 isoprenoid biosynthesis enzyme [Bryobacteraceae bacterium]|nr:class 1 isoprenoid biosynthesis enzyme [Bryobacteraceae bacterium]